MKTVLDAFRVDGRRALVTGGSKGLGKVMAQALAEAGADVAVTSRTASECEAAARAIAAATGQRTAWATCDVTDPASVERMATSVEADLGGPVDILVNNAGINIRGAAQDLSEADWDAVLDTNLKAPFLVARRFGPAMCQRGWGRVLNLGSALSLVAIPGRAPYASAKAGILNLTRVLALEWATCGVTVNTLCPGPFATDMNKSLINDPQKYAEFVARIPMGRWGELHEIAGAALFLCSDASSYVTGATLTIDGGWTAH